MNLKGLTLVFTFCVLLLVNSVYAEDCTVKTEKTYYFDEWSADRLEEIKQGDVQMNLIFKKGQDGMSPVLSLTVYAASEEEAKQYEFTVVNGTGPYINSAVVLRSSSSAASGDMKPSSKMMMGTAAALLTASALNQYDDVPAVVSYGVPLAMMAGVAMADSSSTCTVVANLVVTIAPADFDSTWLAYNESSFWTDAASVGFVDETVPPSITDCSDPMIAAAFPLTCADVPPRVEAIIEAQPLLLDNVFKFYNGADFPHQTCSLQRLQTAVSAKTFYRTFSCQFRNQSPDGSYCGNVINLVDVSANYKPTTSPHQKTAVDNLQKAIEGEVTAWQAFVSQWRKEKVCPTWEIRSDGRCGANFGNAGCNPDRNPCCSTAGWCGSTDAHCGNGGVDYSKGLPTTAPAKQTVRGVACKNNQPGVCVSTSTCSAAGGVSTPGFCDGDSTIQCCGGNNVITQVVTVLTGKKCSGNHPVTQTPGVCISSADCTAAGGTTATGLCPNDPSNILCCHGKNIEVKFATSGKLCGNYANSEVLKITGNNNVVYDVVKVLQNQLVDSSAFYAAPTSRDNTMEVTTACAFDTMRTAALKAGVNIRIASAFRTLGRQQYFWNCFQCGCCNGGNRAAVPGTSNHGRGRALDLNTDCGRQTGSRPNCGGSRVYQWLYNNAQSYGFVRTVFDEPWHWEYIPGQPRTSYS